MAKLESLNIGDQFTFMVGNRRSSIYTLIGDGGGSRVVVASCEEIRTRKAFRNLDVDKVQEVKSDE